MYPFLKFISDEKEHHWRDVLEKVSVYFNLTEEERREKLPSGYDKIINNRVAWTRTYFKKAGLLEYPKRGYVKITRRGLDVLEQSNGSIDVKTLMQFQEFVEFSSPKQKETKQSSSLTNELLIEDYGGESETPEELMERGYKLTYENLKQELLEKLRKGSPEFFEVVVVNLLKKMGYGEGEVVGGSYDGGVDGIIYQDPLRIDKIYLQAKRYSENNTVGQSAIRNFIGALETKGATKGVFITTSSFQRDVNELIEMTPKNLVLIGGEQLVELMIEYNVGITKDKVYEIKKIDVDYFED